MTADSYLPAANGNPSGSPPDREEEILNVQEILRPIRRYWWLLVLAPFATLLLAWSFMKDEPAQYTAEALFQRSAEPQQFSMFQGGGANLSPSVSAEMVVLRSRAVLGPVVDSLGLRLVLRAPFPRSRLFEEVRIGSEASEARYELRPGSSESPLQLRAPEVETAIGAAAPGEWLRAPGIDLLLRADIELEESLEISVLDRERAIERLRSGIDLQQVGQTAIIRARYTHRDPALAADVVSQLIRSYQDHATRRARMETVRRREFLGSLLATAEDSLRVAQEAILRYQEQSGSANPESETSALRGMILSAEDELRTMRSTEEILRTLNRSLQAGELDDEALRRTLILGRGVVPNLERIYNDLMSLRSERTRLTASRFGVTSQSTQVEVVDSLIAEKRAELQALVEQSLETLPDRREILRGQIENLRSLLTGLPAESAALGRLQQRLDRVATRYGVLADRYYDSQIAAAVESGDVEVVDPPVVPTTPNPSGNIRIFPLALAFGILLGIVISFVLDRLNTRIRNEEEAERASHLRVLGTVPLVDLPSGGEKSARPVMVEHGTPGGESFRKIRTMLRFVREERPRLLSVTSPGPAEGKSVVAANLALAYAREDARVLLVDADMRRPTVHLSFGIDGDSPGLSNLLVGEAPMEQVVHYDEGHRVHLITAGTMVPNPAELLGGLAFVRLLDKFRERFDTVIVDTPPILAVADSTLIGPQLDGVLVVARMERTDRGALSEATDQLRQVGAPLLGLVVNAVPSGRRYGYGYGYGPYSSYYTSGNGGGESSGGRIRRWLTAIRS